MRVTSSARQRGSYLCPVDVPLTVLGGRWKMLTQQLRELEADGIVVRTVHDQVPPRVEYPIAEGERPRLEPLVRALADWGASWLRDTGGTVEPGGGGPAQRACG